jgi:hypothetical protein
MNIQIKREALIDIGSLVISASSTERGREMGENLHA